MTMEQKLTLPKPGQSQTPEVSGRKQLAYQAAETTSDHVILSGGKDLLFVCFQ
jgi:hypothetical protein